MWTNTASFETRLDTIIKYTRQSKCLGKYSRQANCQTKANTKSEYETREIGWSCHKWKRDKIAGHDACEQYIAQFTATRFYDRCLTVADEHTDGKASENDAERGDYDGYKCKGCIQFHVFDG